jgi:hypothetical protein
MAETTFGSIVEPVMLTLDRPRRLRLEIWDVLDAEREMCRVWNKAINILTIFADTLTLTDLTILLWASLKHEQPGLTLHEVQGLVHLGNLGDIMTAVMEAWNRGMQAAQPSPNGESGSPFPSAFPGIDSGATPVLS